ncbi:hypothetical protein CBS101457_003615 [Exobasidium rhododendri]|nr:hypothetical protein CBS101457_003615 [Exobasidium rhododendri]
MAPQSRGEEASQGTSSPQGFAAGVVSGLTKVTIGHPFDTIKVRLQCSPMDTYKGPLDCVMQLIRKESLLGLYKGASVPALGWMVTDSILMGSLHTYRVGLSRLLNVGEGTGEKLPISMHALAGFGAGITNSVLTNPIELIKSRLQMQHQRVSLHFPGRSSSVGLNSIKQEYTGPIDCAMQAVRHSGLKGLWHALPGTLLFRSNFAFMFGSNEIFKNLFEKSNNANPNYQVSPGLTTFLSGGLAAEVYWFFAFPADTIKNRMMADSLRNPKYPTIKSAVVAVWNQRGKDAAVHLKVRSFYTGFLVCLLRAFPTNAGALFAFETTMHFLGAEKVRSMAVG